MLKGPIYWIGGKSLLAKSIITFSWNTGAIAKCSQAVSTFNPTLAADAFEIPHEVHTEIQSGGIEGDHCQIERLAKLLGEGVEAELP